MNLRTPPNHLGGHSQRFSEHVFFTPPCPYTLWTRSTFTLHHHQRPPSSPSLSHQTSFLHHSPHQLTIDNHPSPIRTLKWRKITPILILKYHPTTTSTTPPTISNSLLEHHQTPQTPPNSSYIPSKHLSNPPRTIKHDFQHH